MKALVAYFSGSGIGNGKQATMGYQPDVWKTSGGESD